MAGTAVVALGGNALLAEGQRGTYEEQSANAAAMAGPIRALLDDGWRVVVVHGNGPQVGNLAIQQELGRGEVPEMPLFSLGAMTEGQLGSLVAIALYRACGRAQPIAALLSHVIVELDDPAFDRPTKPIGPFLTAEAAREMEQSRGWQVVEDAGRGFRRVVASPSRGASSRSRRSARCWTPATSSSPAAAVASRWPAGPGSGTASTPSSTRTTALRSWPTSCGPRRC